MVVVEASNSFCDLFMSLSETCDHSASLLLVWRHRSVYKILTSLQYIEDGDHGHLSLFRPGTKLFLCWARFLCYIAYRH